MSLPVIEAPALEGVRHAFFTRQGGVSDGVYASLNGGVGSRDAPAAVEENRRRMAAALGVSTLLVPYQIHSPTCVAVSEPWHERPRADALATATPGLALGVTGADCGMTLYADRTAGVVGASHSGWKGALDGVLEATLDTMESLGADRRNIVAVLGPTIGPTSYETGPEFRDRFPRERRRLRRLLPGRRHAPVTTCSTCRASSATACAQPASARSCRSSSTPTSTRRASSPIAGRPTVRSRITAG